MLDLVAAAENVFLGGEESLDPPDPVVGLDEIEAEQRRGQEAGRGEVAELDPADEQDHRRQPGQQNGRPEIGLEKDQDHGDDEHGQGDGQSLQLVDRVLLGLGVRREKQDQADLGQLRRLKAQAGEDEPAVRPGDARHDQAEGEKGDRHAEEPVDEGGLEEEGFLDGHQEDDEDEPDDGPEDLLDHEMERLVVLLAGHEAR